MNRIEDLIKILDTEEVRSRVESAKAKGICKICGKPAVNFRTHREQLEYNRSLMCQSCQDYYLSD